MFSTHMHRIRRFMRRPAADQLAVAQAFILLGIARCAIVVLPFARLEPWLGTRLAESPHELPLQARAEVRRVRWAVEAASARTPWKSTCFPQAIAAKVLLRRRGVPSTLYLGAAFTARNERRLLAHAWLRAGRMPVTGGADNSGFGAVISFA